MIFCFLIQWNTRKSGYPAKKLCVAFWVIGSYCLLTTNIGNHQIPWKTNLVLLIHSTWLATDPRKRLGSCATSTFCLKSGICRRPSGKTPNFPLFTMKTVSLATESSDLSSSVRDMISMFAKFGSEKSELLLKADSAGRTNTWTLVGESCKLDWPGFSSAGMFART